MVQLLLVAVLEEVLAAKFHFWVVGRDVVGKVRIVRQYKLFGSRLDPTDVFVILFLEVQPQQIVLVVTPCKYFTSARDSETLSVAGVYLTYFILLDFLLNEHGLLRECIPLQLFLLGAQLLIFAPKIGV